MADTLGALDIPPLQRECRGAARALQEFLIPQTVSPLVLSVLATEANLFERVQAHHAAGIAILQVYKIGFVGSIRYGTGVVVARLPSGRWSAPGAVVTYGAGIGPQAGVLSVSLLCLLNRAAVEALVRGDSVVVGSSAAIALGSRGRSGEGVTELWQRDAPKAIILSYARASGLYGGLSFEGGVLQQRRETNNTFYGKDVTLREILSGAVPPPYESLNFFYDVLARLDPPSSTGAIDVVDDDKGKSKEKAALKIERDTSAAVPSLAAAPSHAHAQHPLPSSGFASKSQLHAELEHLLNEPFDERKRQEILEKIRSLPLSAPAPIHSEAWRPSAEQSSAHFPPEKPFKAKNEVYSSQVDAFDAPKSPISHHLVHPSSHPIGINEPPEIELHNDDDFSTIQASLQAQGIGGNVGDGGSGMLEDWYMGNDDLLGEGDGHGMFSQPKEKQIDKSARKAERANEALRGILGDVEKSAKVQIDATAHKIHDVAVATKDKVAGVVEAVAAKVGLGKGKDETEVLASEASTPVPLTAPTSEATATATITPLQSITDALASDSVPILVPTSAPSTPPPATVPPTEIPIAEAHETIVTPLPSITEALATDTVPVSYRVTSASPSTVETSLSGVMTSTDPDVLTSAETGTITERFQRLDEDPGGFGMDVSRETAPNPQDKKSLGKEEERPTTPNEPSPAPNKGLLGSLVDKVAAMMPERAPHDAPNKPGAPTAYFQDLHDRVGQGNKESSGSGANHLLHDARDDSSHVFDDDDEDMGTEIEIPSSYITAASVLATLHTKTSSSFLPRAASPEPKEWTDAALHMMRVKEAAEREAALTTTSPTPSSDTSGSGSDIHEPEELPTKDVDVKKAKKEEHLTKKGEVKGEVKGEEKGKGETHEEEARKEEEKEGKEEEKPQEEPLPSESIITRDDAKESLLPPIPLQSQEELEAAQPKVSEGEKEKETFEGKEKELEGRAEGPKPAKPAKEGVSEVEGVTIEESQPEEEEEVKLKEVSKPEEEKPKEVLMLKEEEEEVKERKEPQKREEKPKEEEHREFPKPKEEKLQEAPKPKEEEQRQRQAPQKPTEAPSEARPVPISSRDALGQEKGGEPKAKQGPETQTPHAEGHPKAHKARAHKGKGKAKESEIPVRRKSAEHKPGEGTAEHEEKEALHPAKHAQEKGQEAKSVPLKKRRGKVKKEEKQWQPKEHKAPEEVKAAPSTEETEAHEEEGFEGEEEEEEEGGEEVIIGVFYAKVDAEDLEEFPREMELLNEAIDREVESIEGYLQRGDEFAQETPSRPDVDQGLLAQRPSDSLLNQFGEATTQQAKNVGEVLQGQPQRREPELIRPQTPQFGQPRHPPGAQQGFAPAPHLPSATRPTPARAPAQPHPVTEPSAHFAQQGGQLGLGGQPIPLSQAASPSATLPSPPPGGAQLSSQPPASFGLQAASGFPPQQQFPTGTPPHGFQAQQFAPGAHPQHAFAGQQQQYPQQGIPTQHPPQQQGVGVVHGDKFGGAIGVDQGFRFVPVPSAPASVSSQPQAQTTPTPFPSPVTSTQRQTLPHAGIGGLGMQPSSPLPTTAASSSSAFSRGITAAQEAEILRAHQEGGGVLREPQHDQLLELAEAEARVKQPSPGLHRVPPPSPAGIHAHGGIALEEQVKHPHGDASLEEQEKELERKKSSIAAALDASTKEALHQIRVAEAERLQPREKVEEKPVSVATSSTSAQVAPHVPHPVEVFVVQEPLPTPPSSADVTQQLEDAKRLSREMAAKWVEASRLILEQAVAEADALNTQWKTMLAVKLQEAIDRAEQARVDLELRIREAEHVLLERPEQLAELMHAKFTQCLRLNQMAKLDVSRILLESATQGDVFEARLDAALRVKFGEANAIATNRIEAIRSAGEVATPQLHLPHPHP